MGLGGNDDARMSSIVIEVDPDCDQGREKRHFRPSVLWLPPSGRIQERISVLILLTGVGSGSPANAETAGKVLDVSGVTAVAITGDASSVHLTTIDGTSHRATIDSRRSGWFSGWYSSWFFSDCRNGGEMRVENGTLHIDVAPSSWMDLSDCVTEISANIPRGNIVSIDQMALLAKLDGDFATVTIVSKAGDVSLEGHASNINVKGDAIKARIVFDEIKRDEKIEVAAKALDAYLGFGRDAVISYEILAKASFVDSSLKNSLGSKPSVSIKGDYARVTIR